MMNNPENNRIFKGKVRDWEKAARYVDSHFNEFSTPDAAMLYRQVREMFNPASTPLTDDRLKEIQFELHEEASFHQDDFGTQLRSFAGLISQIIKSRRAFATVLNEKDTPELSGATTAVSSENGSEPVVTRNRMVEGNRWSGQFRGVTPVNKGTITYSNGIVYQGGWSSSGPEGEGRLSSPARKGWIVSTTFNKGTVSGRLTFRWPNGDSFTTEPIPPTSSFGDLLKNVKGVYTFANKETEPGQFINGNWVSSVKSTEPVQKQKIFSTAQIAVTSVSAILMLLFIIMSI